VDRVVEPHVVDSQGLACPLRADARNVFADVSTDSQASRQLNKINDF